LDLTESTLLFTLSLLTLPSIVSVVVVVVLTTVSVVGTARPATVSAARTVVVSAAVRSLLPLHAAALSTALIASRANIVLFISLTSEQWGNLPYAPHVLGNHHTRVRSK